MLRNGIPITENSNLKRRLKDKEKNHKWFGTVRYIERGGNTRPRTIGKGNAPGQTTSLAPLETQVLV